MPSLDRTLATLIRSAQPKPAPSRVAKVIGHGITALVVALATSILALGIIAIIDGIITIVTT